MCFCSCFGCMPQKQLEKGRVQSAMAERRMLETRVDDLQTRLAEVNKMLHSVLVTL